MPGQRTASQLVSQARYHSQIIDAGTYRDGFSTDPDTSTTLIPILFFVNQALGYFDAAGYTPATVSVATVSGQYQYTVPSGIGKLVELTFTRSGVDTPLRETTLQDLTGRNRAWRTQQGDPNLYIPMGPHVWLSKVPTTTGPLNIRGQGLSPDLVNPTDVPAILPHYHDALGMFAALLLINSDAENPGREARLNYLLPLWQTRYADVDAVVRARSVLGLEGPLTQRREGGRDTGQRLEGDDS